jgi:hypothetical protein
MIVARQTSGSIPSGPSDLYLRLLRGEITPKKYAERVKKNVDRQLGRQGRAGSVKRSLAS